MQRLQFERLDEATRAYLITARHDRGTLLPIAVANAPGGTYTLHGILGICLPFAYFFIFCPPLGNPLKETLILLGFMLPAFWFLFWASRAAFGLVVHAVDEQRLADQINTDLGAASRYKASSTDAFVTVTTRGSTGSHTLVVNDPHLTVQSNPFELLNQDQQLLVACAPFKSSAIRTLREAPHRHFDRDKLRESERRPG